MKKILAAVILVGMSLPTPACGPDFDYTYIVAASPGLAFKLPELSMKHELGKIPSLATDTRARSVLPEDVTLRSLCNIEPLPIQLTQWQDAWVDAATTADLTDLYAALTESGADRDTAIAICRNYFSIRAGFDKDLKSWAFVPVHIGLFETLDTLARLSREFYLYLDGARAFHQEKYDEAAVAFNEILALPPEKRLYRTTWAYFMLGRMATLARRCPEIATTHPTIVADPLRLFKMARESAVDGFLDTHDVSAGSYYQEALLANFEHDPVGELHALAHYNLSGEYYTAGLLKQASLRLSEMGAIPPEVMADRLSRSVLVAFAASHSIARPEQAERVLTDLKAFPLELTPYEAGRLAWTAYTLGRIDEADALVKLAPNDPYALWTRSRIQLRRGDIKSAIKSLKSAAPQFVQDDSWVRSEELDMHKDYHPADALKNEQGVLLLTRDRYTEALDLFLLGSSWADAAYIAEHVLTLDEINVFLKKCEKEQRYTGPHAGPWYQYVYAEPPVGDPGSDTAAEDTRLRSELDRLRALVGRRMLRERRFAGAAELFPKEWRPLAQAYVEHRQAASSAKNNVERAAHLMQAAHLLRHWGMELVGYEGDPDFAYVNGAFMFQETSVVRADPESWHRFASQTTAQGDIVYYGIALQPEPPGEQWLNALPDFVSLLKPTSEERRRLRLNASKVYRRWHYRFIAADLFKQAAGLLPDQTEEKAQALYYGGKVLNKVLRYEDAVARMGTFHRALVKNCGTLEIGQAAQQKGWFPEEPKAWAEEFSAKAINEAALAMVSDKVAAVQ